MQGERKFGHPRTDAERKARHQSIYGNSDLPPRGTGMIRREIAHGSNNSPLSIATEAKKEFMHPAKMGNLPGNPLTRTGDKVMKNMKENYGSKKGKDSFYASINAKVPGSKSWHKT